MTVPTFPWRGPWLRAAVAAMMVVYVYLLGSVGLPRVHYFYDAVGIRDAGTTWTALTWSPADGKHFLPAAVLGHIEGPLQFLFLNAYYHLVGDLFPLDPATTQIPNTVLALGCAWLIARAGRELGSERAGRLGAAIFLLMPWLAVTIRYPWIFVTLSCLLEQGTLYYYLRLVRDPASPCWRRLAPLSLALYLCTGLDWPSFLSVLTLFLILSGNLGAAVRNRWNLVPGAVVITYATWTAALFFYGRYWNPAHGHLFRQTILLYPFSKVTPDAVFPAAERLWQFAGLTFGPILALAALGLLVAWLPRVAGPELRIPVDRTGRSYLAALTLWAVFLSVPLFKAASSVTYAYVVAVPVAALAGLFLARVPTVAAVGILLVLAFYQVRTLEAWLAFSPNADEQSVLAAALFLNERRPDLLAPGQAAFLPGKVAANVGQYARGRNERVVMPLDFPQKRRLTAVGSPEPLLQDFVTAYEQRGEIRANWLVLPDETLTPDLGLSPAAAAFYRRLLEDPQIAWVAVFRDARGRSLRLGEVKPDGPAAASAPVLSTGALAREYMKRYDRISFLKRNIRHVLHY